MKKPNQLYTFLLLIICLFVSNNSIAQVVSGLKPSVDGKMGEYTEWKKTTVTFDDGTTADIEYRIALATRKGIACHYNVEVKNNSQIKINIRVKSSYYDKLVKSQFGDEAKETLKPGKSVVARMVAQGCKKEKGVDKDDFGICVACDFGVSIFVSKD